MSAFHPKRNTQSYLKGNQINNLEVSPHRTKSSKRNKKCLLHEVFTTSNLIESMYTVKYLTHKIFISVVYCIGKWSFSSHRRHSRINGYYWPFIAGNGQVSSQTEMVLNKKGFIQFYLLQFESITFELTVEFQCSWYRWISFDEL